MLPEGWSGSEVGAWVAAIAGALALLKQGWQAWKKRIAERSEVREALDQSPQVREQLALGNVGEAVAHLNTIIESQSKYAREQDDRLREQAGRIKHLEDRNDALEAEANKWEERYDDEVRARERDKEDADRAIGALRREIEELKQTFARELARREPGEET